LLSNGSIKESVTEIPTLSYGSGHNSSDALDYFHINSIDRDADHNYLVSGRHTSTIYKINGTNGDIIWRLGGKYSNFTCKSGANFGLQHHARFISYSKDDDTEIISVFDNIGKQTDDDIGLHINGSRGKILSLSTKSWTATLIQDFPAPDKIFAFAQGNTQILPNGNAFINWGPAGAVTEFSPNGTVIFHAYLESGDLWENNGVQNYRGFRFNWTGTPNEEPAIVALKHGESTMIYVSWNGDTETKVWKFYGVDGTGTKILIGQEEREGFETGHYVKSELQWTRFQAEAFSKDGKLLRNTEVVGTEPYIYQYVPGRDDLAFGSNQIVLNPSPDILEGF
jgi:hypothetical protein